MENIKRKKYSEGGVFWGILTWLFFWMPLTILITVILTVIFNFGDGWFIIIVPSLIVIPLVLAYKTTRLMSDYDNNYLPLEQKLRVKKLRRLVYGFLLSFMAFIIIVGDPDQYVFKYGIPESLVLSAYIVLPALISIFMVLVVPKLNIAIRNFFKSRKRNKEYRPTYQPNYPKTEPPSSTQPNTMRLWVLNRIVAPVISGIILGALTYMISGDFVIGSGVSLVSLPVSWVMNQG